MLSPAMDEVEWVMDDSMQVVGIRQRCCVEVKTICVRLVDRFPDSPRIYRR
jgi:hypothetical protein